MATEPDASLFGGVSMHECKAIMDESMDIMEQMETDVKQKVFELRKLNDSTVELRNFSVVLSIAFAPLILVVLLGLVFLATSCVEVYGVVMLFVWLSLLSIIYSGLVSLALMHRRQHAASAQQANNQEHQGIYAQLRQYADKLKAEASAYDCPTRRAAFCQTPWLASVALLGIELSMAASCGYLLTFLQAFGCSLVAALGSGKLLGHVHGTLGPPDATALELAAAALARCPWVAQTLAAVVALGEPFVEESCPSAVELQTLGAQKLEKCTLYLQKVEVLRSKMQKRAGRVLDTAASLEKAIGGTAEEQEESIKDLTAKAGANAKGMVSAATKLFGFGPQEGEAREDMKAAAAASGELISGSIGLALNAAGVFQAQKPAAQAQQAMRGGIDLFTALVK